MGPTQAQQSQSVPAISIRWNETPAQEASALKIDGPARLPSASRIPRLALKASHSAITGSQSAKRRHVKNFAARTRPATAALAAERPLRSPRSSYSTSGGVVYLLPMLNIG